MNMVLCQFYEYRTFFHKISKKQEKKAGINFALFFGSRNVIRQFIKTYLHRLIKMLQVFTDGGI